MHLLFFDVFKDSKSIYILNVLPNVQVCMCNICVFLKAHEACGPLEIDSALKTVQTLKSELQDAKMSVIDSLLKPLPGETVSAHRHLLCIIHLKDYTVQIDNKPMRSQLCNLSLFVCSVACTAGEVRSGSRKYFKSRGLLHGSVADMCRTGQ